MSASTTYECGYIFHNDSGKLAEKAFWKQYDAMLIKKFEEECNGHQTYSQPD